MTDKENLDEEPKTPKNAPQGAGDSPEWVSKVFDFMSTINERLQALEKTPAPDPAPAPPAPAPQEDKKQEDKKGNGLYF